MLVSGVVAGLAAGIAFGGDWRRLSTLNINWWPLLAIASLLRALTFVLPQAELSVYILGFIGIGLVAALNGRLPGAALIALGTFANVAVILANGGMPYDVAVVKSVEARIPDDGLHILLTSATSLPFLSDIIPFGVGHAVYSIGDFLIAFGGFLIPFMWLQPPVDAKAHSVRSANFAFFWLAQVISRFGDPITVVALMFVTYRATQSALLTAVAVGVATIPNALFGFIGGAIADALGPRRAMFWCDVARAIIVGTIPILIAFDAPLIVIFAFAFLAGCAGAIFGPARGALVPALLTREKLASGNSLVYASDRAVEIGGALAGGALIVAVGDGAFYVDALTFALSAVLLARVVVQEGRHSMTWSRLAHDARDGLLFIRRSTVLWSNTLFSLLAQFFNPVINTLTPVFLIRRFAGNDPIGGAVLYAGSEAAIALGAVLGSAILPAYVARVPKGKMVLIGFAATGVIVILIALAPTFAVAAALFAVLGFTNVLFYVPTITILQEATPQERIASVFGARIALTNLSWLPIIFLGGLIGDVVGVDVFLAIAGGVTLVTAIVASFLPVIRDVP
ncbi:MAG: MFS transporter [Chloroflexota bacterium]|nr:MFS transporter [Chloroflexota bacterium]